MNTEQHIDTGRVMSNMFKYFLMGFIVALVSINTSPKPIYIQNVIIIAITSSLVYAILDFSDKKCKQL